MRARKHNIPGTEITVGDALHRSLAENTRSAYRRGWRRFADYCEENGRDPMTATPDDVAKFLVKLASAPRSPRATTGDGEPLAPGTIRIAVAAINRRYRERNVPSPAADLRIVAVLRGLGRLSNRRQRQFKALREWLALCGIAGGPVFQTLRRGGHLQGRAMHPTDIARLVKRYVRAIGMNPAEYSGHSLRAGFVTSAAAHHARLDKIMEVTRHSSADMVLRYVRQADAFEDHAGSSFL